MRRFVALTGLLLLLLGGPALADNGQQTTLLLNPSGQPVGGAWQHWIDQSQELTYHGPMTLDFVSGVCPGTYTALGCSSNYGFTPDALGSDLPETAVDLSVLESYSYVFTPTQAEQWVLLYEQAHIMDSEYLTDGERVELLNDWGVAIPAGESVDAFWWQNLNNDGTQPVMGEWFSAAYSMCALYGRLTWQKVLYAGGWLIPTMNSPVVDELPILQAASNQPLPQVATVADNTALHVQLETCALIDTILPR